MRILFERVFSERELLMSVLINFMCENPHFTGSTSCWKSQHQIKQLKYFAVVILKSCDDLFPTEGIELGGIPEISIIIDYNTRN